MLSRLNKYSVMLLVILIGILSLLWEYYIGYFFASAIILFYVVSIVKLPFTNVRDNTTAIAGAFAFLPAMIALALSYYANQSETGRYIEAAGIVLFFIGIGYEAFQDAKNKTA